MKKIAIINNKRYSIVKSKKDMKNAFANIINGKEITTIIEQSKLDKKKIIKVQKNYRLITFDMILPFSLVGFMAKISGALAEENIPIFVISAYSTDHLLVHEKYLSKAINKIKQLGFEIK
jgi:uncharacterized protein